ncbi:UPF0058 family protein [Haladaptatus salinisoli]|uniref:UPF0058 family protein n=1 Tax=Haladaptatus salinisoli TaxID=2884876 RepID=UPI001D09D725|nr:UPF0058 family protein [Haladaptatus salinisoli]
MKKQELIHLHGLLVEIKTRYEMQNDRALDCTDYEATGVYPTSIHRSKTDHQEAVFKLSEKLTEEMEEEIPTPTPS